MITSIILLALAFTSSAADRPLFALDGWHNNESSNPTHYQWALSSCDMGSFCGLGSRVYNIGNDTVTVRQALSADVLALLSVLIIVDPDTPSETATPHYITVAEADAVEAWVREGGALLMLANDIGNCEFTNLNGLADRFNIHFNADRASTTGDITGLPASPLFEGCTTIHWVNVCTLTPGDSAAAEFTRNSQVLAASAHPGVGKVLAFGDPIWYNEYLNTADNNRFALNVLSWLVDTSTVAVWEKKGRFIGSTGFNVECSPNPFNPVTRIAIAGSRENGIVLIYASTGRLVARLNLEKGACEWDATDQPSGLYLIQVRTGTWELRTKAVLLK